MRSLLSEKRISARSDALHYRQSVAFRVFEPCGLGAAAGRDAVLGLQVRQIVLFEVHALALELSNLAFDVIDLPERLAGLGGSGIGRGVQEACGAAAELIEDASSALSLGLEAELLLIEAPRAI